MNTTEDVLNAAVCDAPAPVAAAQVEAGRLSWLSLRRASDSASNDPPEPRWARRPSRTLKALLALVLLVVLKEAGAVLLPVVIALALTFVLAGPVHRLKRLGIPETVGAGLVVSTLLLVFALIGSTLANPAADWVVRAPKTAGQLLDSLDRISEAVLPPSARLTSSGDGRRSVVASAASASDSLKEKLASEGLSVTRAMIGHLFSFALSAASTVILLYFLLACEPWLLPRVIQSVKRPRDRALMLGGIRQAQREIGLFLGTMSLINLALGGVAGVALAAIGLPNALLWAAVVALLNFVPYLGPAMVGVMLLLAGNMSFGASVAMLMPPLVFLGLHVLESSFITPWILGRRLRLSPLAVFVSVMFWGWMWGLGGALVAVPLLLGLRALCKRRRALKSICLYVDGECASQPGLDTLLHPAPPATRPMVAPAEPVAEPGPTRQLA